MLKSIQGIRVLFTIMIFYHHFTRPSVVQFGLCAVVAFFMLSGFVMSAGYYRIVSGDGFVFCDYYRKRLRKVYPVLLLSIFISVAYKIIQVLASGDPDYLRHVVGTIVYAIPSLFCVQSFIPISGVYFGGNAVAWFLSDILFCYLVFPSICRCIFKSRIHLNMITIVILLIVYVCVMFYMPEKWCHPLLYINPIFRSLDFVIGIYLYKLYVSLLHRKSRVGIVNNRFSFILMEIILIGILLYTLVIAGGVSLRYTAAFLFWLPISLLIFFYAFQESKNSRVPLVLDKISVGGKYTMEFYLFHLIIIGIYYSFLSFENWTIPFVVSSIACIVVVSVIACLIKKYYEPYVDKKIELIWKRNMA